MAGGRRTVEFKASPSARLRLLFSFLAVVAELLGTKGVDAQESLVAGDFQLEFHRSTQICQWLGGKIGGGLKLKFQRYHLAILLNGMSPEIQIQHSIGGVEIAEAQFLGTELLHKRNAS